MRMWLDPTPRVLFIAALAACSDELPRELQEIQSITGPIAGPIADSWSPPIQLRPRAGEDGLAPVHATLLPDGRVLFSGVYRPGPRLGWEAVLDPRAATASPTRLDILDPPYRARDRWVTPQLRVQDSLFCSGHTLLDDGTVLFAGGSRYIEYYETPLHRYRALYGLDYSLRYDHRNNAWSDAGTFAGLSEGGSPLRWYPTVTRLHDRRALVSSGWTYNFIKEDRRLTTSSAWQEIAATWGPSNLSVETGTPALFPGALTFAELSSYDETPAQIFNGNYTHAFQLPSAASGSDVIMIGDFGFPVLLDSETAVYDETTTPRPGTVPPARTSHESSTLLLPLRSVDGQWGYANGSILVAGGASGVFSQAADVYDVAADRWSRVDTQRDRLHPTTVQLPDGHVAIIGGHNRVGSIGVGNVTYLDPVNDFAVRTGQDAMARIRAYHTISLLLPDGRVLVGGGRTGGSVPPENEAPEIQFLSPWYVQFPEYRPSLVSAPPTIDYGTPFTIELDVTSGELDLGLGDVVLIGLGSMTHSVDQNQRYVQLAATRTGTTTAQVVGPTDPRQAPPGYYMLFVLNQYRLPSVAQIVHVR